METWLIMTLMMVLSTIKSTSAKAKLKQFTLPLFRLLQTMYAGDPDFSGMASGRKSAAVDWSVEIRRLTKLLPMAAILLLLLLPVAAFSQRATGSLTAAATTCTNYTTICTQLKIQPLTGGPGGASISVKGTYTGTVNFLATNDNDPAAVPEAISGIPLGDIGGTLVTSVACAGTCAGTWQFNTAGVTRLIARMNPRTSGTANVIIQASGHSPTTAGGGGGGSGDVVGPGSATDNHLAVFDGTTGKLIKDGGAIPSAALTEHYVGYGSAGNTLTGSNLLTFDAAATTAGFLHVGGPSDDPFGGPLDLANTVFAATRTIVDTTGLAIGAAISTTIDPPSVSTATTVGLRIGMSVPSTNTSNIVTGYPLEVAAIHNGSGVISNWYGIVFDTENAGVGEVQVLYGILVDALNSGMGTVGKVYGFYLDGLGGVGTTTAYGFYSNDLAGAATNPYYSWFDSRGVGRCREDATFDSVGQSICVVYNPQFTKYTAGAANYERTVYGQWNGNVAEIGTEAGGTGTLRGVKIIGATLTAPLNAVGTVAGSWCSTSAGLMVYKVGANCF